MRRGHCPFCDNQFFRHGPLGGLAENIRCTACGQEFCLAYPFVSQVLDRNDAGLYGGVFNLKERMRDEKVKWERNYDRPQAAPRKINWRLFWAAGLGPLTFFVLLLLVKGSQPGHWLYRACPSFWDWLFRVN